MNYTTTTGARLGAARAPSDAAAPCQGAASAHDEPGPALRHFAAPDLNDFASVGFDDHVKLMLPARPGAELALPSPGPDGLVWPQDAERR